MAEKKKNMMSTTETLLQEISGKLDKLLEGQAKIVANTAKEVEIEQKELEKWDTTAPAVVKVGMEEKK
jgi:hypothetical protein